MYITITAIYLKMPWHFFALANQARHILKQLKSSPCLQNKQRGIWTKHYTITAWESEADLQAFAKSGAHLQALRNSAKIAKSTAAYTYQAKQLPSWSEAKDLLTKYGKFIHY